MASSRVVAIPVEQKAMLFFEEARRRIVRELNNGVVFSELEDGVSEEWTLNLQCLDDNLEELRTRGDEGFYRMFFKNLHERVRILSEIVPDPSVVVFKLKEIGTVPKCEGMVLYWVSNDKYGNLIIPQYCLSLFMGKGIACIRRRLPAPVRKRA